MKDVHGTLESSLLHMCLVDVHSELWCCASNDIPWLIQINKFARFANIGRRCTDDETIRLMQLWEFWEGRDSFLDPVTALRTCHVSCKLDNT